MQFTYFILWNFNCAKLPNLWQGVNHFTIKIQTKTSYLCCSIDDIFCSASAGIKILGTFIGEFTDIFLCWWYLQLNNYVSFFLGTFPAVESEKSQMIDG